MLKTALITGGARRLGRAMSLHLARRGIDLAIHYNQSEAEALETANECRAVGVKAIALKADLLDEQQAQSLVSLAKAGLDKNLDVLVNNASTFLHDTCLSADLKSWSHNMGTNLRAPFVLSQHFAEQAPIPKLDTNNEPIPSGCIINMIDQRVLKLTPQYATYTLAKAALWTFTQTSAQALAPRIRVNAIGPGPTLPSPDQTQEIFNNQRTTIILKRGPHPSDIAAALGYILDAKGMTGQLICVDGGQHLSWQTPDLI